MTVGFIDLVSSANPMQKPSRTAVRQPVEKLNALRVAMSLSDLGGGEPIIRGGFDVGPQLVKNLNAPQAALLGSVNRLCSLG